MPKHKDNVDLICSVAELSGLFANSRDLQEFLQQVVNMVAAHMHAAVCSIYLYDEDSEELVLSATRGLNPAAIGKTRLKLGEGITGMALKELRVIREAEGKRSPYFKFIPGTHEEQYTAFLAVPIIRGITRIGVMVLQDTSRGYFDDQDSKALRAISSQLAGTIENARMLISLRPGPAFPSFGQKNKDLNMPEFFKGEPGAEGIVRGPAASYGRLEISAIERVIEPAAAANLTLEDFDQALERTTSELEALEDGMKNAMADLAASMIFSAHLLMLKDQSFSGEIRRRITEGTDVLSAVRDVVEDFINLFKASANSRVKEKCQDIQDLGVRLIENMVPDKIPAGHYEGKIVIAENMLPSDMLKVVTQKAIGVVLGEGSFTAHLAILARALGLPLVIVNDDRIQKVPEGTDLLIDANQGTIHINPKPEVVDHYAEIEAAGKKLADVAEIVAPQTFTADGCRVNLLANINLLSELELAKQAHAEGVGLYRSEFPYLVRNDFPSEEEQYRIYRKLVEAMEGKPVSFRTLDIGGDKMLSYFPAVNEGNPFLGLRAIRFSMRYPDVFTQQVRAFLRAGFEADIGIMFPLIAGVDDFLKAVSLVENCIEELAAEKVDFNASPRLGAMIELPSAVAVIDELARRADFLCLGTNDLVQYILAVDRTNSEVAEHYITHHPAVLRFVAKVAAAALNADKDLSICGEMAGDPLLLPFLIGIGFRKFSLDARKIPAVQKRIAEIDVANAKCLVEKLLNMETAQEIENEMHKAFPVEEPGA